MLRSTFYIALLHIKLTLVQRSVFFFSLLMPIIFTALMSQANFGDANSGNKQLSIVDEDKGDIAQELISHLGTGERWKIVTRDREDALSDLRHGKTVAMIGIKPGFSKEAWEGKTPTLEFRASLLEGKQAQLAMLSLKAAIARTEATLHTADARAGLVGSPPIIIKEEQIANRTGSERRVPSGPNQSSPGMLVMFAMLFMATGTNIIIHERRLGTLRRLMVMPVPKSSFLFGKLFGIYLLGIAQMALLIIAGALFFRVDWGHSRLALITLVLTFGLVNTSLGILLAVLVRTAEQANALASLAVLAFSALGGAWWPLDIVPRSMRILGHALPTAWAMDGFHDLIIRGLGVRAILPELGVLLVLAVAFLSVGVWRFRYN